VTERLARGLYLLSLLLLPWGALLPLAALHEHASLGDVVFALATVAWAGTLLAARRRPTLRLVHLALGAYLGWAVLSLCVASAPPPSGPAKLLGMAMLAGLLVVTSEMMGRPGMPAAIGRTVAATAVAAAAAVAGVVLGLLGRATPFVGTSGDLLPGPLPRPQAGFIHPNLLASFCVFASAVVAREDAGLGRGLRRFVQAALALTVLLTLSRAILAFVLSFAVRQASTPRRKRLAALGALAFAAVMVVLTACNLALEPTRPWEARLLETPSPRLQAARTALATLAAHPLFGSGPGSQPARVDEAPCDAHLTPLNVAATLGVPALLALVTLVAALWRQRQRPTDLVTWGLLAAFALDGLGQDVEDFRHLWIALGLADAGRRRET